MIGGFPRRPDGDDAFGRWAQWVQDSIMELRPMAGPGGATNRTTRGTQRLWLPQKGSVGISIGLYRFKSMAANHLVCRTWDGTNEGSADALIAKVPKLRFSIASEFVDSVVVSYSSYSLTGQTRHAAGTAIAEDQVITPRYLVNDLIYAIPTTTIVSAGTPSAALTLIDMNLDSRMWCRIPHL